MPWVSEELCTGCGVCVDECYASAISMIEEVAFIDETECIRCGVCHDVCPSDAVRHDGERVPEEVAANLAWAEELLEHDYYSGDSQKREELYQRLLRYFNKNKKVMEKSIERLKLIWDEKYGEKADD